MENAKKMIIISPDDLQRIQSQQNQVKPSGNRHDTVSELDREMLSLLNNKDLSDQDKWSQYQQVLQRYLHFASQKRKPVQIPVIDLETQKHKTLNTDELVETFTKTYKSDAKNLLRHIGKRHEKIDWDDNGTLFINGEIVPNTNIIDLLHDIIRVRKATQPQGWKQMIHALKDISTPIEFITNPFARNYYERLKGYVSPSDKSIKPAYSFTEEERKQSPFSVIAESETPKRPTTPAFSSLQPVRKVKDKRWEHFKLK